jgi:hypothetical protein
MSSCNTHRGTASFQFNAEDPLEFSISGDTVQREWERHGRDAGASDTSQAATFKAGGLLLSGSSIPTPGQVIVVTLALQPKGRV